MSYWKWERLTGKFSNDYDPINYDNIMVTGYLGVAIRLYASAAMRRKVLLTVSSLTNTTSSAALATSPTLCTRTCQPTTTASVPEHSS